MQKWNISTNRAQTVDEKNGIICLVMFTSRDMVIKMSKMAHFMYFLMNIAKISPSLEKIFKGIWKGVLNAFRKYNGLCSFELPLAKFQHLEMQDIVISMLI